MGDQAPITWHTYRAENRLVADGIRATAVLIYAGLPLVIAIFGSQLPSLINSVLLAVLVLLVVALLPLTGVLATSADIAVETEGLRIIIIGPLHIFVPWTTLAAGTLRQVKASPIVNTVLLQSWDKVHAVYVPGIPALTAVGMTYGIGQIPLFIVTPDHDRQEYLLQRLEHMQQPDDESQETVDGDDDGDEDPRLQEQTDDHHAL